MADDVLNSVDNKKYSWNVKKFIESTPCVRNSLLYGMAGSVLVGAGYFIKSMHIVRSCRYAVGAFGFISFGSWEVCRYIRYKEKEAIKETVDMMNKHSQQSNEEDSNHD
ncbi:Cytochrome c oxidase assembly protein cox20, mitochondrial [Desmophyllum pertusum]|uniref:Cytochrome c oxidase assembly protein COX20, mitochondrial n=1 Tax=Desmophyllum pertusum TaxID=174260 RepID=A0A9W9Z1Q0_9CNID|nr:Cytochrome c oxidase assembly protein cox20, mitochondrial [Desmophyllum pertusum]